ncbi:MAG: peptidylprolyl isomerase [Clostridia bacterium]|nr:peptidylprolyl isomerase [Clostridia bacterium]
MEKTSSQQRREKKQRKKEREHIARKKQKRTNVVAWIVAVTLVAVVAIVTTVIIINSVSKKISKENSEINQIAVKSKYYELTLGDMQYLYYDNYNDFMNDNSENININEEVSLKDQYYDETAGITWYNYFLQQAKDNAESFILLASAAKDEGYTLSEKEKDDIDGIIEAFEEYGAEEGYTLQGYIEYAYGEGITEANIRKCQEIKKLATRYYTDKVDAATLAYTDDDYTSFLEENFDAYASQTCFIDYTYFSFEATFDENATEEEIKTSREQAYGLAEELQASESAEEFDGIILKYIETAKLAETTGVTSEEYLQDVYKRTMGYNEDDDFAKWAFSDERQTGDSTIIEIEENVFVVYYLNKSLYFNEDSTKNFRQILMETENYASEDATRSTALNIIKEWENGEATEESFSALVKEYSTDISSVENGGLYMYVREGELDIDNFDEWLFDDSRKPGSIGLIKSDAGYHIVYFCGDGVPTWQAILVQPMQEDVYENLKEPLKGIYNVTFNNELLNKIVG